MELKNFDLTPIERFLMIVSPQKAYKRALARLEVEEFIQQRNYDAGQYDRVNSGWSPITTQSGEYTDRSYRRIIRARAQDLERNSDVFNSVTGSLVRNVVGAGLVLQVQTGDDDLNKAILTLWSRWCRARNCDIRGEQSFNEIIRMVVSRRKIDGGILINKVYTNYGVLPFQIQLIEVDEFAENQAKPKDTGNVVVGGIEKNQAGRTIGFWINEYTADGKRSNTAKFIPYDNIIFFHNKTRPSQIREVSPMSSVITRLRDITSYMESVSLKERIAANMAVFIKRTVNQTPYGRPGYGAVDQSSGYAETTITPGMIMELAPGDDVAPVSPASQGSDSAEFIRLQQRMASAGQGLSYETTSRDMSQSNYSSARQGLIEDEATFAIEQNSLIEHVLSEIYETFLISAVVSGRLKINAIDFWKNKEKYLTHKWRPRARKWIDPLKEASANKIALQTKQKTLQDIANEQGKDYQELIDEIAEIEAYATSKGVILENAK